MADFRLQGLADLPGLSSLVPRQILFLSGGRSSALSQSREPISVFVRNSGCDIARTLYCSSSVSSHKVAPSQNCPGPIMCVYCDAFAGKSGNVEKLTCKTEFLW